MSSATNEKPRSPQVEAEVFLAQHRRIRDLELSADETKSVSKAAIQTAKACGVNLAAYKLVRKWAKMETREVEALITEAMRYAKILGLGLFEQTDLFADNSDPIAEISAKALEVHNDWAAEKEGYQAGKAGNPPDGRYAPGTSAHVSYMSGWHDGDEARKAALSLGEEVITPKRGGRNPEDGDE